MRTISKGAKVSNKFEEFCLVLTLKSRPSEQLNTRHCFPIACQRKQLNHFHGIKYFYEKDDTSKAVIVDLREILERGWLPNLHPHLRII